MDVVDIGRRRRFSDGEKVRIVEESMSGKNFARATARRYGVALSGLYLWRRQYQRGELGGSAPGFRPVEFLPETSAAAAFAAPDGADKIEVVLLNGRKLVVPTAVSTEVLARFIAIEYSTALAHLFHGHVASHSMTCGHPREVICEAIYS